MTRRPFSAARGQALRRPLFVIAAVLAQVGIAVAVSGWPPDSRPSGVRATGAFDAVQAVNPTTTSTATTSTTTTTTTEVPSTTQAPTTTEVPATPETPSTTSAPATSPPADAVPTVPSGGISPYIGLGTWVDVFDFHPPHTSPRAPSVVPADVDRMAAAGIETLYLQAARPEDPKAPRDLVAPELLADFLVRSHARGIKVVAWYLPHLSNIDDDMRHLAAILEFDVEGHRFDSVSLDIEWRAGVADHATRSERLVELSRRFRAAAGERSISATVMPPVVTDVINPNFWPGFPWEALAPLYNAWLPMAYWTNRTAGSTYRDAHRYTADNVNMVRQHVGAGAPVHVIGGIGNAATLADYEAFKRAAGETSAIGISIYDWATTASDAWPVLRG